MLSLKIQSRFMWSAALVSLVLLAAYSAQKDNQPSPIHGAPSEYTLTLDASTAPTTSSTFLDVVRTIRYTQFQFFGVRASLGNFLELDSWGEFKNLETSQITSVTSVTANYVSAGMLEVWAQKTQVDEGMVYALTSGVRLNFAALPYYLDFWTNEYPVTIQSLVITYTCVPSL